MSNRRRAEGMAAGSCGIAEFHHRLAAEIGRADRLQRPLAVVIFELPALPEGSSPEELERTLCEAVRKGGPWSVLRTPWHRLSQFIERRSWPKADIPARLSGQRLAVALPETDQVAAAAKRISRRLSEAAMGPITVSFACYPRDGRTVAELMKSATRPLRTI